MKKFLNLLLIIALFFVLATPTYAGYDLYTIDVYREVGYRTTAGGFGDAITSGITYQVLDPGADTEATIYSDAGVTGKTNPVTTTIFATEDQITFYILDTTTTVDIIIVDTAGGYTLFINGADNTTTHCVIDERPNVVHHGMIWFASTASSTEVDTGIEFDKDTAIHNVIIEVVTIDSDIFMDVGLDSSGTNGDSDGFIDGVMLGTVGFKNPKSMYGPLGGTGQTAFSSGASEQYHWLPGTAYLGVLLGTTITGNDDTAEDEGHQLYYDWICDATDEQSLIYVYSETEPDTAAGYIHYFFTRIR